MEYAGDAGHGALDSSMEYDSTSWAARTVSGIRYAVSRRVPWTASARFLSVVDATARADAATRFACMTPYRNFGPTVPSTVSEYATLSDNVKSTCAAGLKAIYDNISSNRVLYEAASSPLRFAVALHHARLVQQYEAMIAIANSTASSRSRDASMAENIGWIRDQGGANAKIALWAHKRSTSMRCHR